VIDFLIPFGNLHTVSVVRKCRVVKPPLQVLPETDT
jgi:hypothetical protein